MDTQNNFFKEAIPVWPGNKEHEMNICAEIIFRAEHMDKPIMHITGATFYQVFLNGELLHYGPARKAKGYASVDVIKLPEGGKTEIVIRAIGYNCRCFNGATGISFVQAEITDGDKMLAATGKFGFEYYLLNSHLQKVTRYSSQRHFSECWNYNKFKDKCEVKEIEPNVIYCERGTPFSQFHTRVAELVKTESYIRVDELKLPLFNYLTEELEGFDAFEYDELDAKPLEEYLKTRISPSGNKKIEAWSFEKIEAGFFRLEIESEEGGSILLAYAEQLGEDGRPNLKCVDSGNVIRITIPKGRHTIYSLEPYTAMYAEVLHMEGDIKLNSMVIKELAFPADDIIPFETEDEQLNEIYNAAVRTFRHNTLDIFMDCPSRERAGWLFDSFYTAKAEYALTGKCVVEEEFLHNFLNGGSRKGWGGITEMCYPSDVYSGTVVPQWSMWYVQELYEYFTKRGHMEEKSLFEEQIFSLTEYYLHYENEYGLLERLPGWNFVEWSQLNNRVFDVSWPTNMLYADTLEKIGELYGKAYLKSKAERMRETIRKMAFDGKLFHDRAMRNRTGILENTDEFSETAQYYAIFFGLSDESEKYDLIRNILLEKQSINDIKGHGDIEPSDVMPGLYMKLDLLLQNKEYEIAIGIIKEYFGHMARITGTLWERKTGWTSRNHGFASFVAVAIKEAMGK